MATVIDLSQSRTPASELAPNSTSLASRPLPFFAVIAVVVLFFGAVRQMQHGPAADASGIDVVGVLSDTPSVLAPIELGSESFGEMTVITVREGDSLWSIASELQPGRDPRPLVAAMIEANGGSAVQIGQEIVIPVGFFEGATALR